MPVIERGSVRADLVGGTLDIDPIQLVIPNVVTLNLALGLKCSVEIIDFDQGLQIISKNYNKTYQYDNDALQKIATEPESFEEMRFIMELLYYFKASNLSISVNSEAPAGSGLGGSSSMGVVIYKALCSYYSRDFKALDAIEITRALESRILNAGMPGYQDYYPAVFGGILALRPHLQGIHVEQLYDQRSRDFLTSHLTLAYSGQSRLSGINNWEVYKGFFDGNQHIRQGLNSIATNAWETYQNFKNKNFDLVLKGLLIEAKLRGELFPDIMTDEMKALESDLKNQVKGAGIKVCGAGGGGCFLVVHPENARNEVLELLSSHEMNHLHFEIEPSLETMVW